MGLKGLLLDILVFFFLFTLHFWASLVGTALSALYG